MKKTATLLSLFISLTLTTVAQQYIRFLPSPHLKATRGITTQSLAAKNGQYQFDALHSYVKGKKMILLGESHWMNEVNSLLAQLVLDLQKNDYYPTLVLEVPYSATAFINAFLAADSTRMSQQMAIIKPFFKSKESMSFLKDIRNWNLQNPDKKITIACTDLEHNLGFTLKTVFDPFFKAAGHDGLIPLVKKTGSLNTDILQYMDSVLNTAPAETIVKDVPFLTLTYVKNVFSNFKASYEAGSLMDQGDAKGYETKRVAQIYTHLTNDAFFGLPIKNGKSVLWGGANHAKVYDVSKKMEGWLLANQFEATKGQVVSIKVTAFAYTIPKSYQELNSYNGTDSFDRLVNLYKKDVSHSKSGSYRVLDALTPFSAGISFNSFKQQKQAQYINRTALLQAAKINTALKNDPQWKECISHDLTIVLPTATLFDYSS